MSEQTNLLSKLGNWFRRGSRDGELPLSDHHDIEPRSTFLRPWARRDAAIDQLHQGFGTLTELMESIRDGIDRSGKRQDELANYFSQLPEVIRSLPESTRANGDALRAIHQQLEQQHNHQEKLSAILQKLSEGDGESREAMTEIRDQVNNIRETDQAISSSLSSLGSALQTVSSNSTAGAHVLQGMRERLDERDQQLEQILHRQGTRFTSMLAVAIFLSVSALVAVCVIGYLLINKQAI